MFTPFCLFGFDPVSSAISAGGSVVSSGINAISNRRTNKINYQMNKETNAANMRNAQLAADTNIAMNRENNAFAHNEADLSYQRQIEQWQRENEYNTPMAQMQRYREAGLNPAVMMEGQSAIASSAPSEPVASPSSFAGAPAAQALPFQIKPFMPGQDIANMFQSLSQGLVSLAEARKKGVETNQIQTLLDDTLRNLRADAVGKEIANDFAPFINSGQLRKQDAEVLHLYQQALLSAKEGQVADAQKSLLDAQKITEKWKSEDMRIVAENAQKRIDSEIREINSRSNANNASAEASRARAVESRSNAALTDEQTKVLRDSSQYIVNQRKWLSRIEGNNYSLSEHDKNLAWATLSTELNRIKNVGLLSEAQYQLMQENVKAAQHDNDWRVYHEILDGLERVNNGITNWIPFAPDKETTTRQEVRQYDKDTGTSYNTVTNVRYRGKGK